MSTGAIIAIVVVAVLIIGLLAFLVSPGRKREKQLRAERDQAASHHRELATERQSTASLAERKAEEARLAAEKAERDAEIARREAELHHDRADLHERGELDHELLADRDADAQADDTQRAGTDGVTGRPAADTGHSTGTAPPPDQPRT